MNKKAYMRTLEAVFAIIIFLIAIFGILSIYQEKSEVKPQDIELTQDVILNEIEHNLTLRNEVLTLSELGEETDTYRFIINSLPNRLNFRISICQEEDVGGCDFASPSNIEKIYVDSIIVRGENPPKTVLLTFALWSKLD